MSTPQAEARVHRLVDMVVEEVSLVDRAANQRRFLIVKRDDAMSETGQSEDKPNVEKQSDDSPLGIAVSALEGLTAVVELLSELGADRIDPRIAELAASLRSTTDKMLAQLTGESASEGVEEKQKTESATDAPTDQLTANLQAVKEALSQLSALVDKADSPAAAPEAATISIAPLEEAISKLGDSLRELSGLVQEQQGRLAQVEKQFGLPNSASSIEHVSKPSFEDVGWPLDLNKPMDRESVDKAISFHDL